MKNKILKIFIILFVVVSLTGCTKTLKDENKKIVKNPKTGQTITKNILCKPESKDILKIYKENKVNISKLPKCDEFKANSGGYDGIWATIFIKPLAWFIIEVGKLFNNYGLAVIFITILIRLVMYPVTKNTAAQSENMKNAKPTLEKLEKKYDGKTDQASQMQKSQEMMAIYKKYNINPLAGCLFALIQIPLFFAFYEALNRIPALFEGSFLGLKLGMSPGTAIMDGEIWYAIIIILVVGATFFSMKMNKTASMSEEQERQMATMTKVMIVIISISSVTVSTGLALYWIANSSFTILQNLIVKRR
jgi:membrane protein insertase, YidC/Oxa1 family, C-terminal domain